MLHIFPDADGATPPYTNAYGESMIFCTQPCSPGAWFTTTAACASCSSLPARSPGSAHGVLSPGVQRGAPICEFCFCMLLAGSGCTRICRSLHAENAG